MTMPDGSPAPSILTQREAARLLRVSETTLYRWRMEKQLRAMGGSRHVRFSLEELLRFSREQTESFAK
jgi:excisionase family DNA binding protein